MEESVEQLDPTAEITSETVKKRVVSGAAMLTIRTIFIQFVSFFSNALLTVFLLPADYGVFFLVSAVINLLAYFSDIGFAAALIQKKDKLTQDDLRTIFTAQQVLIVLLLIVIFIATPFVQSFYKFNQEGVYLLWALAFSLFVSSLKTIPSVLMERKLEFNKLVIPQIIETLVFNITVVYLAWKGYGVTSFTIGVIARSIVGLVSTYIIQPWLPMISFSSKAFKSILKFGLPYQANVFLAMLKDDGMTLFLGSILGPSGIGLLGWAQKWAYAPLRFFMDQVIKVTFPAFSRLQDNKAELSHLVSRSIFYICILVFPTLILLVLLAPSLTQIIPKYNKWSPALLALTFISITSAFASITTPLTNMLNAIGKISLTFKFMIMWTALTWLFVPFLSIQFGVSGAGFGFALVGLSSVITIWKCSEFVNIDYFKLLLKPILAVFVMGVLVSLLRSILPVSYLSVISMGLFGLVTYLTLLLILEPELLSLVKRTIKLRR